MTEETVPRWRLAAPVAIATLSMAYIACSGGETASDGASTDGPPAPQGEPSNAPPAGGDPWASLEAINELPTDLEQQVAVEQLLVHAPGAYPPPPSVCARLKREQARGRCLTLAERPHLIEKSERSTDASVTPDPAAADREFACLGTPCEEGQTPFECAKERAEAASRTEDGDVVGICECVADLDLRRECRFFAAEEAVRARGAEALERAMDLCGFGGKFQTDCVWHVMEPVTGDPEESCPVAHGKWAEMFEVGFGLKDAGRARGGSRGEQERWSRATIEAYREVFCLPPGVASALPPEALPHLRAAAAWHAVAAASPGGDLEQLRSEASAALAGESVLGPVQGAEIVDFGAAPPQNSLSYQTPAGVERQVHLVTARRAASPDPDVDLTICLLEAEARLGRDPAPLLDQVGESDDPALRSTVERLRGLAGSAE